MSGCEWLVILGNRGLVDVGVNNENIYHHKQAANSGKQETQNRYPGYQG